MAPWPFQYHSVQDALNILDPRSYMAKVDLTRMYHQIPLHPGVRKFFAYRLAGRIWTCICAPFGGTSTPAFANLLAGITALMLMERGIESIWVTDDSFYAAPTLEECLAHLEAAMRLIARLGWLINLDKVEGPTQLIIFLGIQIDSIRQTIAIPAARLLAILEKIHELQQASRLTVRDIRSIAGRLQWVATLYPRDAHLLRTYIWTRLGTTQPAPPYLRHPQQI